MKQHYTSKEDGEYANEGRWPDLIFHMLCDGRIEIVSPQARIVVHPSTERIEEAADLIQDEEGWRQWAGIEGQDALQAIGANKTGAVES